MDGVQIQKMKSQLTKKDVVDHEERRVEIIDVSDNEGEEQFPPPPKRPKVVHESSDNRNLGT